MKDANIRFLGLCAMVTLVRINGCLTIFFVNEITNSGPDEILEHLVTVVDACKDSDVSVAKKALDLLFLMTEESNVREVVAELLVMLTTSHDSIKEEIVVKIAIIAESYTDDMAWYVDTLVQVVLSAGSFVSEDVWFRVVQVVTNHPEVQEYASAKLFAAVQGKFAHQTTVTLAGYILGEFGVSICQQPESSGYEQFSALHQHFMKVDTRVQAMLLTCYAKLMNLYPDTKPAIEEVFDKFSTSAILEIQQRACEYRRLAELGADVMETVLNQMPAFAEDKRNILLSRIEKSEKQTTDRAWQLPAEVSEEEESPVTSTANVLSPSSKNKVGDLLSLEEEIAEEDVPFSPGVSRTTTRLTAAEIADAKKRHVTFSRAGQGMPPLYIQIRVTAFLF